MKTFYPGLLSCNISFAHEPPSYCTLRDYLASKTMKTISIVNLKIVTDYIFKKGRVHLDLKKFVYRDLWNLQQIHA